MKKVKFLYNSEGNNRQTQLPFMGKPLNGKMKGEGGEDSIKGWEGLAQGENSWQLPSRLEPWRGGCSAQSLKVSF
ncbi:hypothetical protein ACQP3D_28940, partial [Escherichia coli]